MCIYAWLKLHCKAPNHAISVAMPRLRYAVVVCLNVWPVQRSTVLPAAAAAASMQAHAQALWSVHCKICIDAKKQAWRYALALTYIKWSLKRQCPSLRMPVGNWQVACKQMASAMAMAAKSFGDPSCGTVLCWLGQRMLPSLQNAVWHWLAQTM